ncbi:hypothetical protein OEG88_06155 [Clostridium perfringens]|uniref:hypothetical protein n=1 Tax=Clostridium perfringens TaxID=1502 RepID=UPI001A28FA6A|nr:hypothetical protein [Clostridium perfringens]UYC94151.1 hypothetical protein OEG88_06155 [Clostridium perfringens]HAT4156191.1 hypothetical protein [Clostridium perfringens]HAT4228808.1 hypothetical protein [Clostridium perfringens]
MKINEIENTIENFEKYMTVFFNKKTGLIVGCPTGINDMTNYEKHDPELLEIWDYEIFPLDLNVIYNRDSFRVKDRELVLISTPETFKYKFIKNLK